MTLAQRTYLHTDGDDGADPLTNLLNPGPNVSILPHVPMLDAKVMAWTFIATAFGAGLVLAWMFTTGGLTQ
jgi:hypothetical protein